MKTSKGSTPKGREKKRKENQTKGNKKKKEKHSSIPTKFNKQDVEEIDVGLAADLVEDYQVQRVMENLKKAAKQAERPKSPTE